MPVNSPKPKERIVSSKGRACDFVRFFGYVQIGNSNKDCWIWNGGKNRQGYGHFKIGNVTVRAHRWIYNAAVGRIPEGMVVRHQCDNPSCVNPAHLTIGTSSENMQDMVARCRNSNRKGILHPLAKLKENDVREIRKLCRLGITHRAISEQFNISAGQVTKIAIGCRWSHIKD